MIALADRWLRIPQLGARWLSPRGERVLVDVLAALIGAVGELSLLYNDDSPVRPVPVTLTVCAGAALLGRRRYPLSLLAAMLAVTAGLFVLGESPGGALALVALFTVAERFPTPVSVLALVATTVVLVALSVTSVPPPLAVWAVAVALRGRREHQDELKARSAAEQLEREHRAAIAAHEQRAAIARELHDIVAHSVTVMLIGVRGARDALGTRPQVAADVLSRVESSAEHSLVELRRLLTLLRAGTTTAGGTAIAAPDRPLPGIGDLSDLVAGFRAAGLSVALELPDLPPSLDEGVGLSVYRIVEEALTNVARHASTGRATVRLGQLGDELCLEVIDDGAGPAGGGAAGGHGIAGMRERALLLGGRFESGPAPNGGFRVGVRLPLRAGR